MKKMLRKNILKKDKRGSIIDTFFLIVTLFGLAIFLVIIGYTVPKISDQLKNTELNQSSASLTALNEMDNTIAKFDGIFLFIFIGLIMSILISAFLIDSHPIFIPIFIFLLGFAVVVSAILSNVYNTISTDSTLSSVATTLPYTNTILNNFVLIIIGVGVLSMIVIFGKSGISGGRL